MMILALTLAHLAPAAPPPASEDTIIVTGTLRSLGDALERCKQGGCTPRQDIVASIRYAEAVFRSGRYVEARRVLQDAIARNKAAAKSEPVAVAALYEATATAAAHDGEQDVVTSATNTRMRVLREALPPDSVAVLQAALDVADMHLRAKRFDEAQTEYEGVARHAEAARQPDLLADVLMRQAILAHSRRHDAVAHALLDRVIGNDAVAPAYRLAARATAARFARERGDKGATDALIASFSKSGELGQPLLLWQPQVPSPTDSVNLNAFNIVDSTTRSSDAVRASWVDIGFLIKPDGTVETPEVLRGSGGQGWATPILGAIAQRRYAPPGTASAAAPLYRVERWTLTADYDTPIGSLVRRRTRNPHFEQIDLTASEP